MESIDERVRLKLAHALRAGDMFALFETSREALRIDPDDPEARYLQALAMARLGEPLAARRLYERNRVEAIGGEDAVALKGRILKDLAIRAESEAQAALFREASDAYSQANALSDGYFSAINAATTAFLAGDRKRAALIASAVGERADIRDPQSYYAAASAAEAALVRGEVERAIDLLHAARARADANPGMMASTCRQVGLIADRLGDAGQAGALRDAIRPAPLLHFCGHMLAAGWSGEAAVAAGIAAVLDGTGATIGYGALACGGDIMVAEALLARGGEVHVVLPFAEEDFLRESVAVGGGDWVERYQAVKAAAETVTLATQMRSVHDDEQFAYCSQLVMGLARLRAAVMYARIFQLAVWDGSPPRGPAGTAADCAEWARQGGETRIVPVPRERPPLARALAAPRQEASVNWQLRSILFADFAGFSTLDEDNLSRFLEVVMARLARVLDRHEADVLCRNSWGDAIYVVVRGPAEAAALALEIQAALDTETLARIGLPADGGMRISLHHGPIFEHFDAVQRGPTFYGTEVTVAARIEPRVPVGAIYATQPFAALSGVASDAYHFELVGKMDLAKNYGMRTLYRLVADRPQPATA
ncbi:tetratricopeptide repeat-containing protein [Sphingomonas sp. ASV193]|uniref:tetratricopeptide repeat-containing protein n=1 Tax=Sphingomonas sp. ASV193 TaxID=3144405 RepID=UPI0032E8BA14